MKIGNLIRSFNTAVVMLLLFGGMALYMSIPDLIISFKPAVSFEELLEDGTQLKAGSHVAGNVVYVLDYFASESSYTKRSDGSRSGSRKSGNYYLIPSSTGYFALKSREADVAALNQLSEETFTYLSSGTEPATEFFMEGKAEPLEGNLARYFEEYLEELGYTAEEVAELGEPLVVRFVSFTAVRVMTGLGALSLVLGLFLLRRNYRREERGSGLPKAEDLPEMP
ncbi:MAG: hypothetical protein HFG55_05615 [Lachnospiraceae bacterium]|nr:hypothetical protein [Lachnospiraceae bacterium]